MLLLSRPTIETLEEDDSRGRFVIGPLERGFGHTLGNSLRRTLLSSIPGAAVTQVQLDGAIHEFGTIEGVVEDVSDIILNFKDLVLKIPEDSEDIEIKIVQSGPAAVTGEALANSSGIEVVNPDLHIATVNNKSALSGVVTISRGRGYRQAGPAGPDSTEGVIPIDAIFSPIRRVTFVVEETADGSDQLILDVTTDKTLKPSEAVASAAGTLRSLLGVIEDLTEEFPQVQVEQVAAMAAAEELVDRRLIEELQLSERAQNCLKRAQINTIGELIGSTPKELLQITNFGEKSLREVQEILAAHGLSLVESLDEDAAFAAIDGDQNAAAAEDADDATDDAANETAETAEAASAEA